LSPKIIFSFEYIHFKLLMLGKHIKARKL